jgi:hypothetical protein
MEWFSGKTSIRHSNFKLDDRSGCRHCNLAHLQLYTLSRSDLFRVVVIRALVAFAIVSIFLDRAQD